MSTLKYLDRIYGKKHTATDIRSIWKEYVDSLHVKRNADAKKIAVFVGVYGTSYWRVFIPFMELAKNPNFDIMISVMMFDEDAEWADTIVLQRCANERIFEILKKAKAKGKKIVFETDDNLHNHPYYNPGKKAFENTVYSKHTTEIMQLADRMSVSTEYLKKSYQMLNKNIHVLPNSVNVDHWEEKNSFRKTNDSINLAWAGSNTHSKDLEIVSNVVEQAVEKYPNVNYVTSGWDGRYKIRDKEKYAFYDAFLNLPIERRIHFEWSDYPHRVCKYMKHFDIGLAPLLDNEFNKAKSNVKFLEYSMCKIPTIASDIEAYNNGVEKNPTILIKGNKFNKWLSATKEFIESKKKRTEVGIDSYNYVVDKYNIINNVKLWEEFYASL